MALIDRTIGFLDRHDKTKNSELLKTLETFYENQMNIDKTASDLYVHSNTVRHRINKAQKLLEHEMFYRTYHMDLRLLIFLEKVHKIYKNEF
ncbi:MAG: helix-turn-helix domain-containing protein [Bacillota bacterium]|nr:helix-turn-helix domain-containing protein [Bacillota bacterium]